MKSELVISDNLFEISKKLISEFPKAFVHIECHEDIPSDWEIPDLLWLVHTPNDVFSEGRYLSLSRATENGSVWHASIDEAHKHGGHPTCWSETGSLESLLGTLINMMSTEMNSLKSE